MSTQLQPSLPIIDHKPEPYTGPSRDKVLALRHQYLSPGIITYYRDPLMIVEGHMQYVWDENGPALSRCLRRHRHGQRRPLPSEDRRACARASRQACSTRRRSTSTRPSSSSPRSSPRKCPPASRRSYFTNSGSEANEVAILSAREFTGNQDVIALRNGYHGGTSVPMALTAHGTWKFKTNNTTNIHHTHPAYCYRCPYGLEYPSCDLKCAHDIKNVIQYQTPGEIACFIGEPIQGVGGTITPPKEFFGIVYDIVRKHGGICIADEVQGGFGRTGHHYWAHQNCDVVPDMITMAKGIGNGAPLGAMTTTERHLRRHEEPHPLQHLRRQPDQHDARPRHARNHRRGKHPAERARSRHASQGRPRSTCKISTRSSAKSAAWA